MKLSKFIVDNMETIIVEWESFARTIQPAAKTMDRLTLRDHAELILIAAAKDIETDQTEVERSDKSKGWAPALSGKETAATTHGTLRHVAGFDLEQLGSEFRALRASVLRQWKAKLTDFNESQFDELMRFNEAIDQALAESITSYSEAVDRSRHTLLAIVGHDLLGPLSAINNAAHVLKDSDAFHARRIEIAALIQRSVQSMSRMAEDLLEYAGGKIGKKIPVKPEAADLNIVCQTAIDEAQLAFPKALFHFEAVGNLEGSFDPTRCQQVLSNLLINAAKYSFANELVTLSAYKDAESINVEVKNFGNPIPPESLQVIFDPLVQLSPEEAGSNPSASVGLGLFIAREIVEGHDGTIEATSSETDGTIFRVRLPA